MYEKAKKNKTIMYKLVYIGLIRKLSTNNISIKLDNFCIFMIHNNKIHSLQGSIKLSECLHRLKEV